MNGSGIKRKRLGERAWREILTSMDASGLSATAYCQREGLAVASLKRWRERLSKPAPATPTQSARDADTAASPTAPMSPAPLTRTPSAKAPTPTTPKFIELGTLGQASVGCGRLEIKLDLGDGLSLHLVRG